MWVEGAARWVPVRGAGWTSIRAPLQVRARDQEPEHGVPSGTLDAWKSGRRLVAPVGARDAKNHCRSGRVSVGAGRVRARDEGTAARRPDDSQERQLSDFP